MNRLPLLLACILAVVLSVPVHAHEVRPAYLELRQTGVERFDVLWRVPARDGFRLALRPLLPGNCDANSPVVAERVDGAFVDRWSVTCDGGLAGNSVVIEGLSTTITDVLARVERQDGTVQVARLTPDAPALLVEASSSWVQVAGTYLALGVEHILLGIDHLLFILALLLLLEGWRRLLAAITAFTAAHSLTLAAATLGVVHVPQQPVEAVIALSIVFVAGEIVRARSGQSGLTHRWPWSVAFAFGLLHGLGFAGALSEIGVPESAVPLALLFFNLGVELGQILFVCGVLIALVLARRLAVTFPAWARRLPAYGVGGVAAFWTIERVAGF